MPAIGYVTKQASGGYKGQLKTLTIRAFLTEFDRLLAERTGRRDLGSRVVRVKVADLLSEWLGQSDKNVEELFNDIQAVASAEVARAPSSGAAARRTPRSFATCSRRSSGARCAPAQSDCRKAMTAVWSAEDAATNRSRARRP